MLTTPGHEKPPGAATPHARPRALSNDRARTVPIKRRNRMSFSDHKITAFTHRIADLPDQPNLPADELKARFDSSPEELRESVNGICDDADRLEERVSGIIAETFGDSIPKSMLSDELQDELDAKATKTELAEGLAAKCEVLIGTYTGDGTAQRTIELGFQPKAVLLISSYAFVTMNPYCYGGLATPAHPLLYQNTESLAVTNSGFTVYQKQNGGYAAKTNADSLLYYYIAFV